MKVKNANSSAESRSNNTPSVQGRQDALNHQRQQRRNSFAGRGNLLATKKGYTTAPLCDCNSELLEEELRQFRKSSAEAIQNSWNEVETLQKTCMQYDDKIQETRQEIEWKTTHLDDCLTRFDDLVQELEDLNDNDASSRTSTLQHSEHSIVQENDNGHDDLRKNRNAKFESHPMFRQEITKRRD
jgi:chromosome segregation ATPase